MASLYRTVILSTLVLAIGSVPSCVFDANRLITTCTGDSDYTLQRGLVSDNNYTREIILKQCGLTVIEPEAFSGLAGLRNLDLSNNKLSSIKPATFNGAGQLTHLSLAFNNIRLLPQGTFDYVPRLELLDLKGNDLVSFEPGIFDPLSRLGHLDLSSNNFRGRTLDQYLFDKSPSIYFMDFSGSDMTEASDKLLRAFTFIGLLNLSGCSLTEIPKFATAANLKTLKHLLLINNLITSISNPATFHNLINLQILNFDGNAIEFINKDVFRRLKKLNSINLSRNRLRNIPIELFRDLESLSDVDLSDNLLQFMSANAFRGTSLKSLNVNNNRLTYLTANFILELSNSRAILRKFSFDNNPWQCACLRDILKEAKARAVEYGSTRYNGKQVVCVTTKEFYCKRQPNFNELYIEMYDNLVK